MAYNKKYAELGESVIDYVNDREDAIEQGFEEVNEELNGIFSSIFYAPRKSGQNLNNATSGFAFYTTNNQNAPQEWVIVLTVDSGANSKFQQAWGMGSPIVYFRNFGSGSWSDWKVIG